MNRLLGALADGLTIKQACAASGISDGTLLDWREQHPELLPRLEEAREQARQKALAGIKAAADDDWRAWEAFLKYSFWQDYRQNQSINVSATATTQTAMLISEDQRKRLIDMREKILHSKATTFQASNTAANTVETEQRERALERLPTKPSEIEAKEAPLTPLQEWRNAPDEGGVKAEESAYEGEPWGEMPGVPGLERE